MRTSAVVAAVSILILSGAVSADAQCGARVGEWPYGPTFAAAGDGAIAVYGSGRVMHVADVSNPAAPAVLGSLTLNNRVADAVLDGDMAFVAAFEAGLLSVDISRPGRPEVIGSFQNLDRVAKVVLVGQTAYVANHNGGLLILDVSDPTTPTEIARVDFEETVADVAVHGNVAYLANDENGLQVVDISDPSAPTVIGALGDIDDIYNVGVSPDGQLVIVAATYESLYRLIDVSDPTTPTQVGTIDTWSSAYDVVIKGDLAYLANRSNGMLIYDISDPTAPVEVQQVRPDGQTEDVTIHGDLAYMANHYGGMRLVDITIPAEAAEVGFIEAFSDLKHATMDGGLAVASAGGQLITLDVSDPTTPTEIATTIIPGYANAALIDGDFAYVAAANRGLHVVDVSDPGNPEVIGTAETCDAHHLARHEDTVFVACESEGLGVVDLSSSTDPQVIGSLDGFRGSSVAHADGVLYMPDYDTGLYIIDVTDPTAPSHVSILEVPRAYHPPTVNGNRLFVPTSREGVFVYDITNPREPLEIGNIFPSTYLSGAAPVGEVLFIASIFNGGYVFDVSNPSAAVELARVDFAMDREGEVTSEGSLVMLTEKEVGFEIFDLAACFNESPTAAFTWRPGNPEAGRSVQLTDTSFGTIATRSWDFGDGATSSQRFPTHVWAEAGSYEVSLTVSGPMGSQSIAQTVTVIPRTGGVPPITDPGEHVYVIAAAAHAPGLANTRWVTDAVLHNPGSSDAQAYLWFMKASQNNTGAEGIGVVVTAGASTSIDDLVSSLFGEDNAAGAVLIGSDQPLLVTSRTYNDASSGTYGQFIPGHRLDDAVTGDEIVRLIELTRSNDFRTNLGVANPTASSVQVDVSLRSANGSEIATRELTIPPFGYLQRTDILGTDVDDAIAIVSSTTPGATYFPYASVVDNRTGDPILVGPIQPDDLQVIAAAAHVGGLVGTDWRTDLEVCNPLKTTVDLEIRLLATGQNNSNPTSVPITLSRGSCNRLTDVLETSFSHEGTAALEIAATSGELIASSRTFNTTDQGTFGQFLPGIPTADVQPSGQWARITQLTQDAGSSTGYRTNLGFVNRSATATSIDVELRSSNGSLLGTLEIQLAPFEHRQINRVFRQATSAPVANGTIAVSTSTAGNSFVAYASVVDNASGDPIYIPATPVAD